MKQHPHCSKPSGRPGRRIYLPAVLIAAAVLLGGCTDSTGSGFDDDDFVVTDPSQPDYRAVRLECLEEALAIKSPYRIADSRRMDKHARLFYIEALLGVRSEIGTDATLRLAGAFGAAKRLGHDVDECLMDSTQTNAPAQDVQS